MKNIKLKNRNEINRTNNPSVNSKTVSTEEKIMDVVIIIVIILIIVGMILTGENGVLAKIENTKTKITKIEITKAEAKERVESEILASVADDGKYNKDKAKENLEKNLGITNENIAVEEKGTLKVNYSGYAFNVDENGIVNEVYTSGGPLASSVLKIDTTNNTSPYVNYIDKNGNKILCKVLYDEAYNKAKGTDYGIQLVSVNPVTTVTLGYEDPTIPEEMAADDSIEKSKYSYNNAITTLNNKAEEYRNSNLTDEGGARCIGSNPSNLFSESKNFTGGYTYLDTYGWNGLFKDIDTNYEEDWNQLDVIGARKTTDTSISSYYWLASRKIKSYSSYTYLEIRNAMSIGKLYSANLCYVHCTGREYYNSSSYGFRPVFSIKATVQIKEGVGDGTSPDNAYELQ